MGKHQNWQERFWWELKIKWNRNFRISATWTCVNLLKTKLSKYCKKVEQNREYQNITHAIPFERFVLKRFVLKCFETVPVVPIVSWIWNHHNFITLTWNSLSSHYTHSWTQSSSFGRTSRNEITNFKLVNKSRNADQQKLTSQTRKKWTIYQDDHFSRCWRRCQCRTVDCNPWTSCIEGLLTWKFGELLRRCKTLVSRWHYQWNNLSVKHTISVKHSLSKWMQIDKKNPKGSGHVFTHSECTNWLSYNWRTHSKKMDEKSLSAKQSERVILLFAAVLLSSNEPLNYRVADKKPPWARLPQAAPHTGHLHPPPRSVWNKKAKQKKTTTEERPEQRNWEETGEDLKATKLGSTHKERRQLWVGFFFSLFFPNKSCNYD